MKFTQKVFLAFFIIAVFASSPIFADTIELKNGKKIEGEVLSLNAKKVYYRKNTRVKTEKRDNIIQIIFESLDSPEGKNKSCEKKDVEQVNKSQAEEKKKPIVVSKTLKEKPKTVFKEKKVIKKQEPQKNKLEKKSVKLFNNDDFNLEYSTYIYGVTSSNKYLALYGDNKNNKNIKLSFPLKTPKTLSFKLHAQQNGKLDPLETSSYLVFYDNNLKEIKRTDYFSVKNKGFVEWFEGLENIIGAVGAEEVQVDIPDKTYFVKIVGYRPNSTANLMGYISGISIDRKQLTNY